MQLQPSSHTLYTCRSESFLHSRNSCTSDRSECPSMQVVATPGDTTHNATHVTRNECQLEIRSPTSRKRRRNNSRTIGYRWRITISREKQSEYQTMMMDMDMKGSVLNMDWTPVDRRNTTASPKEKRHSSTNHGEKNSSLWLLKEPFAQFIDCSFDIYRWWTGCHYYEKNTLEIWKH